MAKNATTKYRELRVRLLKRGESLRSWAQKNKVPVTTVYGAARGERFGKKSAQIMEDLETYANS